MVRRKGSGPILPLFIHSITTTGLFPQGTHAPRISPRFVHPTRAPALSKEHAEHPGQKRTLSPGAQGVPYEFAPVLTSQEPPLHHADGSVLWPTPSANCAWTFRHCASGPLFMTILFAVFWAVAKAPRPVCSTWTSGQQETLPSALHGQHNTLRKKQVYSPLLPTEADHEYFTDFSSSQFM